MTVRNVVLITIDCLRPDHLGCYGYTRLTSPRIDSFAREGIRFTQAIATGPVTPASFFSILTSNYPLTFAGYRGLSSDQTIVSMLLTGGGLSCAGFHSNPHLSSSFGYSRGFDTFVEFGLKRGKAKRTDGGLYPKARAVARRLWQRLWRERTLWLPYASASVVTQAVKTWLLQVEEPFFLWVHYMDAHNPYYPPKSYLEQAAERTIPRSRMTALARKMNSSEPITALDLRDTIDLYDGCIAYVDNAVGEIASTLSGLGLWDDTAIIITADHGEEFMEHGGTTHRAKLYDELLRVPLIIRAPGALAGRVIDTQISMLDTSPTILDLVGLPPCTRFAGRSLKSLIMPCDTTRLELTTGEGDELVFSQCYHEGEKIRFSASEGGVLAAVRTPGWKYIWDEERNQDELYDLLSDPDEQVNLISEEPEQRDRLRQVLLNHLESLSIHDAEPSQVVAELEDDESVLARLRALGYLDS